MASGLASIGLLIVTLKHQQGRVAVAGFASVHWLLRPHAGQRVGSFGSCVAIVLEFLLEARAR